MVNISDIRKLIKVRINLYLKTFDTTESPAEIFNKIAHYEEKQTGLEVIFIGDLTDRDGQYSQEQKKIYINDNIDYKPRVLFTSYHELMHYLLQNVFEEEYSIFLDTIASLSNQQYSKSIEELCNYGAGLFLIPDSRLNLSPNTLINGQEFKSFVENQSTSSIPALLSRLSYETMSHCIFVIIKKGLLKGNFDNNVFFKDVPNVQESTYIEYAFNSLTHVYPLKRFHTLETKHLLNFNNMNDHCIYSVEKTYFPYSQSRKEIPTWVTGYKSESDERFFGILYSKMPCIISEDQRTLFD
jgi:Zn-dependent peptidase ImmA (M78 family)